MNVSIRPASGVDAPVVTAMYVESSNVAFAGRQPPMELTPARFDRWAHDLDAPMHRWWLAFDGATAVGFAGIGPSRDPVDPRLGELDTIAVVPARWRRGVGRALIALANDGLDADGYEASILWTWTDDARVDGFYSASGWERTTRTRDAGRQVMFRRRHSAAELGRDQADDPA